jgi:hypothetical protein
MAPSYQRRQNAFGLIPASKFFETVLEEWLAWAVKPRIGKQGKHPLTQNFRFGLKAEVFHACLKCPLLGAKRT